MRGWALANAPSAAKQGGEELGGFHRGWPVLLSRENKKKKKKEEIAGELKKKVEENSGRNRNRKKRKEHVSVNVKIMEVKNDVIDNKF